MMKKTKLGLLLLSLCFCARSHARITDGAGHWTGKGSVIAVDGQDLGEFTVEVDRTTVDARTVDVQGKVTLASGQVIAFSERQIAGTAGGFRIESSAGKGGGRCFGDGLCQTYVETGADTARASYMAADGSEKLRVLITELDHGRAVRFIRQTLTRKQ
jgi:hypothetical protein